MTKSTTRKTTARKTAASRKAGQKRPDSKAAPEPMDVTAREVDAPDEYATRARECYAAKTLLGEVAALFPDATYEDDTRNGRGVLIGLAFELASLSDDDAADLVALMTLFDFNAEPRIEDVTHDEAERLLHVAFRNDPRSYDSRAPFGLADAMLVLAGDADDAEGIRFDVDTDGSL